eukprot:TRINITY_DN59183_c0_g1_i1.p1 TRINITY_DN59183_c0_g1~~TRINITY_DN59183_c0_g1_i1.p1  ORF type:complete len:202 (-),score=19.78 TRINITY_DN59183_c0_g1_i1:250-855(-)
MFFFAGAGVLMMCAVLTVLSSAERRSVPISTTSNTSSGLEQNCCREQLTLDYRADLWLNKRAVRKLIKHSATVAATDSLALGSNTVRNAIGSWIKENPRYRSRILQRTCAEVFTKGVHNVYYVCACKGCNCVRLTFDTKDGHLTDHKTCQAAEVEVQHEAEANAKADEEQKKLEAKREDDKKEEARARANEEAELQQKMTL